MKILPDPLQFIWNAGNQNKNWEKHKVTAREAEEVFVHEPFLLLDDDRHSGKEKRYHAWGRSNANRKLFLAVTIRDGFVRIISARDMSKKERRMYEEAEKAKKAARV